MKPCVAVVVVAKEVVVVVIAVVVVAAVAVETKSAQRPAIPHQPLTLAPTETQHLTRLLYQV